MSRLLPQLRKAGVEECVAGDGWDLHPGQIAIRRLESSGLQSETLFEESAKGGRGRKDRQDDLFGDT